MAKQKFNFVKLFRGKIESLRTVFAEEGETLTEPNKEDGTKTESTTTATQTTINYEDLIAKARKEEKDKLYPILDDYKVKNKALVEKNNALLLQIGEKESIIDDLKKGTDTTLIESEKKSLQDKITALEKQLEEVVPIEDLEAQIRQELEADYVLKDYRNEVIRKALGENVGLIEELVTGETKEEIDASLEISKNRFKDIASRVAPTQTFNPVNPQNNSKDFSNIRPEDIKNMTMNEYAEYRKALGLGK